MVRIYYNVEWNYSLPVRFQKSFLIFLSEFIGTNLPVAFTNASLNATSTSGLFKEERLKQVRKNPTVVYETKENMRLL